MSVLGGLFDSLTSSDTGADEADERLKSVASVSEAALRSPPTVKTVAEVNEHADTGDPILVPVVTCSLEGESEPSKDAVAQYVGAVCERLSGIYPNDHVRQFDIRFEFGSGGLFGSRDCRRVTVPPELAAKLTDMEYDYRDLATDVEEGDDGDSVIPPVAWGECHSYTSGSGSGGAVAAGAAAGGAASCGAGGAGGGC